MAEFGVGRDGFTIKPFTSILAESQARARAMFGPSIDLEPTSPLRKILDLAAAEDAELWQRLEELYYSTFASSAVGAELDVVAENVGVTRRQLVAQGTANVQVQNPPQADRLYTLPEGTIFATTAAPLRTFHTTEPISLMGTAPAPVRLRAFDSGPASNVAQNTAMAIDPEFALLDLEMVAPTTVVGVATETFSGGQDAERDEDLRARVIGMPRNLWTVEAVRSAARGVIGVTDVALRDPLGGVDVSQSYFNLFNFDERLFSGERRLGEPYFFDVVVAHEFARPWRTTTIAPLGAPVVGIFERVTAAVDEVRPVGIHPNIVEADHIEVSVRAQVIVAGGYDQQAVIAALKERLRDQVGALKLGGDVLYSQVMCVFAEEPGVVDVQNMHLRRCPPAFGRITFGEVPFQGMILETPPGENLVLGPTEVAAFRLDSDLLDLQVIAR